ncbi:hypothetical protein B0O80DRAFT_473459 [Mortierella sp. GBAus27b]|nr:hypothetical protein B0O80DRAFT_473459 [Mortierella sp. GBAus27b]
MGVKYAWLLPKNKGLVPDAQDRITLASAESKLRVDVSSVHYSTIRYLYTNPTDINEAHTKLEYWMSKYGDKENTRFYVDGEVALEKSRTHIDRQQRRQVALAKADTGISDLESRLVEEKRVRKRHISTVYKNLRDGFHWSIEHRTSFVDFMKSKGYDIVLCQTEADVLIATECKPEDAVVSCDSDMLFYKTIPKVWRPVGSFKSRRFVPYEKTSLLQALGLSSTQLTALGILSGNDYVSNIPHLAIATNRKISDYARSVKDIVRQYLAHPQVKRKIDQDGGCWTEDVYANAIKVFVTMQQSVVSESVLPPPASDSSLKDTTLSFTALTGRMKNFMLAFKEDARKRTVDESSRSINPFDTVDKQNPANAHSYRPRYSYKVRYEPSREQPEPAVSLQYTMKPWKDPPEKPASSTTPKRPVAAIKAQISGEDRFERKEMMDALFFEHPTVTLDLGRLSPNVNAAVENEPIANGIIECIRGAVKVAWDTKRRCQMLIGLYLEDLFYPRPSPGAPRPATPVEIIGDDDQAILDNGRNNDDERPNEDGKDDGSNAPFIRSFLTFLYSGNSPGKNKTGNAVSTFISRLQDMGHLENYEGNRAEIFRNIKEFTPGFVVRSVASQLSVELKRHYRHGSEKLSEKVTLCLRRPVVVVVVVAIYGGHTLIRLARFLCAT